MFALKLLHEKNSMWNCTYTLWFSPLFQTHTPWKNLGLLFQETHLLWDTESLWLTTTFSEKLVIPVLLLDFKVTKDRTTIILK